MTWAVFGFGEAAVAAASSTSSGLLLALVAVGGTIANGVITVTLTWILSRHNPANRTSNRQDGTGEHRKSWKWIKRLVVGQVMTLTIACTAGYLSLQADQSRIDTLQSARVASRRDSCRLLKSLAEKAATSTTRPAVIAYIATTPLQNCNHYAHTDGR